jgi:hypothetical protein
MKMTLISTMMEQKWFQRIKPLQEYAQSTPLKQYTEQDCVMPF